MSDQRKLTKQQESVIVGKVADLYRKGYDVYEIAAELKINRDILADDAYWEQDNFTYNGLPAAKTYRTITKNGKSKKSYIYTSVYKE